MSSDNFVRVAKENIDLRSKVSVLEAQLDQLRGELQKTHIHQHIIQGGPASLGSTASGVRTTPSPPPAALSSIVTSTTLSQADFDKLNDEIRLLNEKNASLSKKLEQKCEEVESTKQHCEKRIWQLQHEFELLSQQHQQVAHTPTTDAKGEVLPLKEEEDGSGGGKELIFKKKWIAAKSQPTVELSAAERGELDALREAVNTLREDIAAEVSRREEAEMMLEFVQNELADAQRQLAEAAPPPAEGEEDDEAPPPDEEDDSIAPPPYSPPSSPKRPPLDPHSPGGLSYGSLAAFQEEHAARIEEIVQNRLEEERYLIEVDHEEALGALQADIEAKDAKISELRLELGRVQLQARKKSKKDEVEREEEIAQADLWASPRRRHGGRSEVTVDEYEAALGKIQQASAGKDEALKQVADLTAKLRRLEKEVKSYESKTPATTSVGVELLKGPTKAESNWAEVLLAERDAQLAEAQSKRLTAESELAVVSSQLASCNDKHREELAVLTSTQARLEREIQDLKRERDQAAQRVSNAGAKNAMLLSRKSGSGSGITFGRAGPVAGGDSSLNSSVTSGESHTPTKAPSKFAAVKPSLRERLLQKQALKSKSSEGKKGTVIDGISADAPVSLEERTRCVDGAAEKADVIVGRLARLMEVGTAEYQKGRHWDPKTDRPPAGDDAAAGPSTMSDETRDALAEMVAESLIDYEFALNQLRNEVLSLRTIVTMTEADVREEYQGRLSRMEAEMGDLRAAAQMHDEERSRLHQAQRARQQQLHLESTAPSSSAVNRASR